MEKRETRPQAAERQHVAVWPTMVQIYRARRPTYVAVAAAVVLLLSFLFALFVWPTPYAITTDPRSRQLLRLHRLNAQVDAMTQTGWVPRNVPTLNDHDWVPADVTLPTNMAKDVGLDLPQCRLWARSVVLRVKNGTPVALTQLRATVSLMPPGVAWNSEQSQAYEGNWASVNIPAHSWAEVTLSVPNLPLSTNGCQWSVSLTAAALSTAIAAAPKPPTAQELESSFRGGFVAPESDRVESAPSFDELVGKPAGQNR